MLTHVNGPSPADSPGQALRGYRVTIVGRATEDYNLIDPPDELAPGVRVEVEEGAVVLTIELDAVNAATALSTARATADDFFRVLASSYAPYRLDPHDERDHITRTDAVYIADGPIPEGDVAEGGVTEAGWAMLDPDGELRRAGRVARLRARGVVGHPITADTRRFAHRQHWSRRLRSALSLYWAGQCSPDRQVRFVLAVAALEVLAERPDSTLLSARLTEQQRRDVRRGVETVLREAKLSAPDVQRLISRLMDTREVGAVPAVAEYLNELIPDGDGGLAGGVTTAEVREWLSQRGAYLHAGPLSEAETASRDKLNLFVGEALRRELDQVVAGQQIR